MLICAAEQCVRARGLAFAALDVEDDDPRACRLYERLRCQASGCRPASWEYEDDDGILRQCETTLTMLQKRLCRRALTAPRGASTRIADPALPASRHADDRAHRRVTP